MSNDVKWTDWRSSEIGGQPLPLTATNLTATNLTATNLTATNLTATKLPATKLPADKPSSALLQLLGCVVGLVGLTVVLPGPASWARLLSAVPAGTPGLASISTAAEAAILVIAAALTWALLVWVLAVWIAAVAGRLPGAPGRCGRSIVRRIAPAAAGRIIATAVGVSLLAGTSACAVPVMAELGSDASAEVASVTTIASTPASLGGGAGVVDSSTSIPADTSPTPAAPTTTVGAGDLDDVLSSITIDWPAVTAPSTIDSPPPADSTPPAETTPPVESTPVDQPPPVAPSPTSETAAPENTDLPTDVASPGTSAPDSAGADRTDIANTAGPITAGPTTPNPPGPTSPAPVTQPADAETAAGVTVRPGDTLWSVAQHHLTPDATDQEIDTAWRAWYSANSQVIGEDPDLIQPGQLLLPPDPEMGR